MTQLGSDKLDEIFGTIEEMQAAHERMMCDVRFLWDHMPEWRRDYLDKWIAVYDQKLIAVADDLDSIHEAVCKLPVPRGEVLLQPIRATYEDVVPSVFRVSE